MKSLITSVPNSSWIQRKDPLHLQEMLVNRSKLISLTDRCHLTTDDMAFWSKNVAFSSSGYRTRRENWRKTYKVCGCYSSVTFLNWKPIFDWLVCGWVRIKEHMFRKRLDFVFSNFIDYSTLNSEHHWEDLYMHSMKYWSRTCAVCSRTITK